MAGPIGWAAPVRPGLPQASPLPAKLLADLCTDHAGEAGAVMIYRGILATTRDAVDRLLAQGHLATESRHLAAIEQLLAPRHRSRLLPLWRAAGWVTGALPAWVGPRAVYATIEAVETFVDHHYTEQIESIDRLDPGRVQASLQGLRAHLCAFRADGSRSPRRCRRALRPLRRPTVSRSSAVDLGGRRGLALGGEDLPLDLNHDHRKGIHDPFQHHPR